MAARRMDVVNPWLNREEWLNVYRALFSEKRDVEWALDRIAVWKARSSTNFLAEIDSTEALFRAKIHTSCELPCRNTYNDALLHSSALMRFVKFISDLGQKKGIDAVNRAARHLGIPEWVVKLRHDVTHSTLPTFEMLRLGVDFALQWLRNYYWDKENKRLSNGIDMTDTALASIETCIRKEVDRFCQLQLQLKKEPNAADLAAVVNPMYAKVKHHGAIFSKILTEPGYLLPTYQQLKDILDEEEMEFLNNKSTVIPDTLLKFWSPVLKLYDARINYYSLLHKLLASSQPHCTSLHRRLIAAWIVKIFNFSKTKHKKKSLLKIPSLDWSKILTEALMCYNEYSPAYLTLMLEDSSVIIPEDKKQHLMALVAIRLGKTMDVLPRSTEKINKVYTIDDLQKVKLCMNDSVIGIEDEICWKICTDPVDWKMYPIGLLPGQTTLNIFNKEVPVQEQLKNSISEDIDISCNITERVPKRCFQEINTVEDNEAIPTKKTLKQIMFF